MPTRDTVLAWSKWTALAAVGACVAGLGAASVFLGTQTGRDGIAALAENALSDDFMTVRIANVRGNLAGGFRIGELSVADASGNVAIVENAAVVWHPLALLGGVLDIGTLDIGRISVAGSGDWSTGPAGEPGGASLPALGLRIGALKVGEIVLDDPMLGERQLLSLTGSLSARAVPVQFAAKARLARTDGAPGHADLEIAYTPRPVRFTARVDIDEPRGGLLARLAGFPATTPISVRLDGAGPPEGWRGRLIARAGALAEVTSDIAVTPGDDHTALSLDGTASFAAMLPPEVRPLFAPTLRFMASIDHSAKDNLVTVGSLTASTGSLSARATGRYDPARDVIAASFSLAASDGLALPALRPGLALDGTTAEGTVEGSFAQPTLSARFGVRRLSMPDAKLTGVAGKLRLSPGAEATTAVASEIRVEALDAGKAIPAGLIASSIDVTIDGLFRPDGTAPRLDLKIASGPLTGNMQASMPRADFLQGRYRLAHASFGDFLSPIGVPLRGALEVGGDFRTDLARGDLHAGFAGALSGTVSNDPWLAALAVPRVSFRGGLNRQADDTLRLTGLEVETGAAKVTGDVTLQPAANRMDVRYSASLPDLARLSRPAGVALGGRLQVSGTANGTLQVPQIAAQVATHALAVDGVALGDIGAGVAARPTADGVRVAVRLGGRIAGKPLSGDLGVAATDTAVRLQRMKIALGGNGLEGDIAIDTVRARLTGEATLALSNARELPAIAGMPAFSSGAGRLRLAFGYDRVQTLGIDADLTNPEVAGSVSAAGLTAKLTVRDPFRDFSVDGTVRLTKVQSDETALDRVSLTAKGQRKSLDWTVVAAGAQPVSLLLEADGKLAIAPDDLAVHVRRLDGKVASHAVRLRKPADMRLSSSRVNAGPIDLAVGSGAILLRAEGSHDKVDISGDVDRLPLALASLVEPDLDLAGTLSGRVRLSGAAPVPTIDATLTASNVRPAELRAEDLPGVSVTATLRQDSAGARLTVGLKGPDETVAEGAVQTPPLVALGPLRLVDAARQPLSGKLDARARLRVINRLVALGEDRLAGQLDAGLTIAGTLAQPVIKGTATLADGAYEGAVTGVVLRKVQARMEFTGTQARLVALSGEDGSGGTLAGSGTFAFEPDAAARDRLTVRLGKFTALRRPEAEIVATGAVALKGPLTAPAVEGKLTVERGELRIPDRLPEDVVELEVEEINLPKSATAPRREEPSASHALPVKLDVAIDFPGKTFVRGRGLDSEWKGALTVRGTGVKPAIAGKLSVVRGTFDFAGKTFVLKSGSVAFPEGGQGEPEIAATAEARLTDLVAQVQIGGRLSRPSLSVTSDPSLPQEEVLAHILFGRATGQLSAIQAAQLAQTAATLSGHGGGTNIVDRVRRALGVDVLNVETADSGTGASLKAGKYITEDVFLSVKQGTQPGSQRVGVEVEVLPNLSVESDIGGSASSNVGVNWKFDY